MSESTFQADPKCVVTKPTELYLMATYALNGSRSLVYMREGSGVSRFDLDDKQWIFGMYQRYQHVTRNTCSGVDGAAVLVRTS